MSYTSDELIKRLRKHAGIAYKTGGPHCNLLYEAADRITGLEAALAARPASHETLLREIMELRMCLDLQAPDDGTELKVPETDAEKSYTQWYAGQFLKHGCHPAIPYLQIWRDAFRAAQPVSERPAEPVAPSPRISDEEILQVAAEHGYGWASERGVIPFSAAEEDGIGIVNLFHALLSRKEGK